MSDFATFLLLTSVMGLSIFLSLPVIWAKRMQSRTVTFLNAAAIGILVFLLADIFSDVAPLIAASSVYLTLPLYDLVFVVSVVGVFALLFVIDQRPSALRKANASGSTQGVIEARPTRLALIIAIGIGLQNLTEGLVFGSAWSLGELGLLAVIFAGFFLQNVTEGFPIVSPLLGSNQSRNLAQVSAYFLVGGLPTILGGAVGYYYNSTLLDVLFDALAIGAILYVIVPMLKASLRPAPDPAQAYVRAQFVYFGLLAGFVLGFVVNAF